MCFFLNVNSRKAVFVFTALIVVTYVLHASVQVYVNLLNELLVLNLQFDFHPSIVKPNIAVKDSIPIIIWWTQFTGESTVTKQCGDVKCTFTPNRLFQNKPSFKAYMFYGSLIELTDLPLPRNGTYVEWALLHEESPKNLLALTDESFLNLFNYSATFSRHSNVQLTLQHLGSLRNLTDLTYFVDTPTKDRLKKYVPGLAPLLYIQSSCNPPSQRDEYVQELMKYIDVDSYGACLQNKNLPPEIADPSYNFDSPEFLRFVARYKFTLAFENAVCDDYVTEKLWRPLSVGSVPVYLGSPTVKDWLPNEKSAILVSDFESPKKLAEYLLMLDSDQEKYESYLQHKLATSNEVKVTNSRLISLLQSPPRDSDGRIEWHSYVEYFQCYVCERIHNNLNLMEKEMSVVTKSHYYCPVPVSPLSRRVDQLNTWVESWYSGACTAKAILNFISLGKNSFTAEELNNEIFQLMRSKQCGQQ